MTPVSVQLLDLACMGAPWNSMAWGVILGRWIAVCPLVPAEAGARREAVCAEMHRLGSRRPYAAEWRVLIRYIERLSIWCEGWETAREAAGVDALREVATRAHWLSAEIMDANDGPFSHPEPPDVEGVRADLNEALDAARPYYDL